MKITSFSRTLSFNEGYMPQIENEENPNINLTYMYFFKNNLTVYRPVEYKDNDIVQIDQYIIPYADVKTCVFDAKAKKLYITYDGHVITKDYKDGISPQAPYSAKRLVDETIIINTGLAPEIDFVKEIEKYSKLKVVIESN